jgi:predicted ArsR family transcriptional regulator
MDEPLDDVVGIAALADPLRRRLYRYVARSSEPVGREEAARAVQVAVHTAKFHLDRMVDDGLLEVEFKRLSGRSGPGAGRPAKLYRRSSRELSVSLPERRYDLLSQILAESAEASVVRRLPVDEVAPDVARRRGVAFGEQHGDSVAHGQSLDRLAAALEDGGYEPRVTDGRMVLENCPFHRAAQEHTDLVCGLNLDFVDGVAEGLGCRGLTTTLEPSVGRCCVSARSTDDASDAAGPGGT